MELNSKKQRLLDSLKSIIDRARAAEKNPQICLTIEYEFAEKLDLDPQGVQFKKSVAEIENNDKAAVVDLYEKTTAEMNKAETTIRTYLEERKIKRDNVIQPLDGCKASQGYHNGQNFCLKQALFALHDDPLANHDDLIKQFATIKTCNKIVEPHYESIIGENRLDQVELEKRKNDKLKKLRHVNKEIRSHILVIKENIKANHQTLLSVDKDLNLFRESEKKCLESNNEQEVDHYLKVCHILIYGASAKLALYDEFTGSKHLNFFKKLGIIKEVRWIDQFNFAPSFDLYLQEVAKLEKCQETKIWYACNKVFDLYQNYANYGTENYNTLEHINCMEKIYSHLEEFLPEDENIPTLTKQDENEILAWYYDHSAKTFKIIIKFCRDSHVERMDVKLRNNKLRPDLINHITKSKKNISKTWDNSALQKEIDSENKAKNRIYHSILGFDNRLALAAKINQKAFFDYDEYTTKIQPNVTKLFNPEIEKIKVDKITKYN